MKKYILTILIVFNIPAFTSLGQSGESENVPDDKFRHFRLSFQGEYLKNGAKNFGAFGLNFEIFPFNNFLSLNYRILAGNGYLHASGGMVGGFNLLLQSISDEGEVEILNSLGTVLLFIPEGVNFNIPYSEYVTVTPFLYPLSWDEINDISGLGLDIGFKVQLLLKSFNITGIVMVKKLYTDGNYWPGIGISTGIRF